MYGTSSDLHQQLCRLCGLYGHHEIDVLQSAPARGAAIPNPTDLSERIFQCVGVRVSSIPFLRCQFGDWLSLAIWCHLQVQRNDRMPTRICRACFDKINEYVRFRDMCDETNIHIRTMMGISIGEDGNDVTREPFAVESAEAHDELQSMCGETLPRTDTPDDIDGSMTALRSDRFTFPYSNCSVISSVYGERVEALTLDDVEISYDSVVTIPPNERCDSPPVMVDGPSARTSARQKKRRSSKTNTKSKRKAAERSKLAPIRCQSAGSCRDYFESLDAMLYHVRHYHARRIEREYSCYLCHRSAPSRQRLLSHMNAIHFDRNRFKCPHPACSKHFNDRSNLRKHVNGRHTQTQTFVCTQCSFRTYYKQNLVQHLATVHDGSTSYTCDWCGAVFCTKRKWRKHLRSRHADVAELWSTVANCSKHFPRKSDSATHISGVFNQFTTFKCANSKHTNCGVAFVVWIRRRDGVPSKLTIKTNIRSEWAELSVVPRNVIVESLNKNQSRPMCSFSCSSIYLSVSWSWR